MKITNKDVENKVIELKIDLRDALACRGVAQLRLNEAAKAFEKVAEALRNHSPEAVYTPLPLVKPLLDDYASANKDINYCVKWLPRLGVSNEEIERILE